MVTGIDSYSKIVLQIPLLNHKMNLDVEYEDHDVN